MSAYRSFADQVAHYLARPNEGVPREPVAGAAAWMGRDVAAEAGQWTHRLSQAQLDELERVTDDMLARGVPIDAVGATQFALPSLADAMRAWRADLSGGRGFVLVKGMPVEAWGYEKSAMAYWGLGHNLGIPGGQNPDEELLGHVQDYREEGDPLSRRAYRGAGDILYHCDAADVVGLLCLHPAKQGGASRIVSSVAVFNEVLRQRPDLAPRLFESVKLDSRGEQAPGAPPFRWMTPCAYGGGQLRTFYHGDYFRSVTRHPEAGPHTPQDQALLDLYEGIGNTPGFYLDMEFEAGDIQLISNHTIVHSRTAYVDWPEPERRRHLLRLWLSLP